VKTREARTKNFNKVKKLVRQIRETHKIMKQSKSTSGDGLYQLHAPSHVLAIPTSPTRTKGKQFGREFDLQLHDDASTVSDRAVEVLMESELAQAFNHRDIAQLCERAQQVCLFSFVLLCPPGRSTRTSS
jgi:hypothetical protein